jgi:hypothetical protein
MTNPLTAAAVEKYRPISGTRRVIRDAGARSLFLVITSTGHKSWMTTVASRGICNGPLSD